MSEQNIEAILIRVLEQLGRDLVRALAPPTLRRRLLAWWRARRRPARQVPRLAPRPPDPPAHWWHRLSPKLIEEWDRDLDRRARKQQRELERPESHGGVDVPADWLSRHRFL